MTRRLPYKQIDLCLWGVQLDGAASVSVARDPQSPCWSGNVVCAPDTGYMQQSVHLLMIRILRNVLFNDQNSFMTRTGAQVQKDPCGPCSSADLEDQFVSRATYNSHYYAHKFQFL